MLVYVIGTILTVILTLFYQVIGKNLTKNVRIKGNRGKGLNVKIDFLKFIPMLPLALISGFRYGVGQDYFYTYVPIFNQAATGQLENTWGEIGYIYLNKIVAMFTNDYAGIFLVTSIIFIYLVFDTIYKESDNWTFSALLLVLMGYYFCFMNGIRQMLAVSILLFSIKYIRERNLIKFLLIIMLASLFHSSALLFIPVYFIYKLKIGPKVMGISIATFYAFSSIVSKYVLNFVGVTKYSWYLDSVYKAERTGIIMILINVCILVFALLFNNDKKNDLFIKIQWLAVISMSFIGKIPVAHRLVWVFGLPGIILIPNVIESRKNKKEKFLLTLVISIIYIIYFVYTIGLKNSNNVLPYHSIFER